MVRVKITTRLHKETDRAFIFTDGSPRFYKGEFKSEMYTIPKSKRHATEVDREASITGFVFSITLDMPQWWYDRLEVEPIFKNKIEKL
jgi:hypothetical protein